MRGPKDKRSESSTERNLFDFPEFVSFTPGIFIRPFSPPTDFKPFVISRMTSGFDFISASLVNGLNGLGKVDAPTSIPPN